ncbi:hypothetical protein KIH39_07565 [Telmatocola sphagniphila]|uniref:Uncharacterized protein n=1 Tax=Telmatocola sphagniphila TaxID=1123043 RepID=A0A8E6BB81_9BACT|nr:hypothetical protein [Telmatocola sphagniphila]QVL33755.1 hypothetical protein KIH39_07565 [Telmatocola sphagniphila]
MSAGRRLMFPIVSLVTLLLTPFPSSAQDPAEDTKKTRIVFRISKEFIRKYQTPVIEDTSPVDMCLFGSHVTGTAHTTGRTSVKLDTNEKDAVFITRFQGSTDSQQVATRRPVAVHSTSKTAFEAQRMIHFDGVRFSADAPTIEATATSVIGDVETPRLFRSVIRRMASREIDRTKPAGDEIGLQEVKTKVLASFDTETTQLVNQLNKIVPYEKAISIVAPKTQGWINHLGTTQNYLLLSPGPKEAEIAVLPKEAKQMRAPLELWVKGQPSGERIRLLLESFTATERAFDLFRAARTGETKKVEGIKFTAVGDWWVLKIGEDLLDQWIDKIEPKPEPPK